MSHYGLECFNASFRSGSKYNDRSTNCHDDRTCNWLQGFPVWGISRYVHATLANTDFLGTPQFLWRTQKPSLLDIMEKRSWTLHQIIFLIHNATFWKLSYHINSHQDRYLKTFRRPCHSIAFTWSMSLCRPVAAVKTWDIKQQPFRMITAKDRKKEWLLGYGPTTILQVLVK